MTADQSKIEAKSFSKALTGLSRGFGGALIFALPLFMTMEMWWIGAYLDRTRLVLLLVLNIPLLTLLSRHAGFEETNLWRDDLRDAGIAYGIGLITCAGTLAVLALINPAMTADEIIGRIAVQSVPASIGAMLASTQLGVHTAEVDESNRPNFYLTALFLMCTGALFLGLNVAPTEEMVLISYKMTQWHAVALIVLSIAVMHGFTFAMEFRGTAKTPESGRLAAFFSFTIVGYAIAVLVSFYVLWTFGRMDDTSFPQNLIAVCVLAFPASVGAAAARLIL
ncbi:MAG: TIGR02587 family membrane protein [Paracoccaceae bacterium]|nr:TIGR02587 family membrane protein [Paracoccaceae bacterium]